MAAFLLIAFVILGVFESSFGIPPPPGINDGENPFYKNVTGRTPAPIVCLPDLCNGKADGNYAMPGPFAEVTKHYFLMCALGRAHCQACWPESLEYSPQCNQCLYNKDDACYTTKPWKPATTYQCPDECPTRIQKLGGGPITANIADPNQPRQYVACWEGVTVGCIACPENLEFSEKYNACLYDGKYWTEFNPFV